MQDHSHAGNNDELLGEADIHCPPLYPSASGSFNRNQQEFCAKALRQEHFLIEFRRIGSNVKVQLN
jgi:hypothetical protein